MIKVIKWILSLICLLFFITNASLAEQKYIPIIVDDICAIVPYSKTINDDDINSKTFSIINKEDKFILENYEISISINNSQNGATKGSLLSFKHLPTNTDILKTGSSFFNVIGTDKRTHTPKEIELIDKNLLKVKFSDIDFEVVFEILIKPEYITFEVKNVSGSGADILQISSNTLFGGDYGKYSGVFLNNKLAFMRTPLSSVVQIDSTSVKIHKKYGFVGAKFAMYVTYRTNSNSLLHKIEKENIVPTTEIDNRYSKLHPDIKKGYLFIDLSENNVDDIINIAKKTNLKYVLIYNTIWSKSNGSYPINSYYYPNGIVGLKRVVDKLHRNGLKVGLHLLHLLVSKNDPLASNIDKLLKRKDGALLEISNGYLIDLEKDLKYSIANRIAKLTVSLSIDMLYFDGAEWARYQEDKYAWRWIGELPMLIVKKIKELDPNHNLLIEGSSSVPWFNHIFSRGGTGDITAFARKEYFVKQRLNVYNILSKSDIAAEVGWCNISGSIPFVSIPATTKEDVEFIASRMMAYDMPLSIEAHIGSLKKHGRLNEFLSLLSLWDKYRLQSIAPQSLKDKMKTGDWHLKVTNGKPLFYPREYKKQYIKQGQNSFTVANKFRDQSLRFIMQVMPTLSLNSSKNITLFNSVLELSLPPKNVPMPGYKVAGYRYNNNINLSKNKALAVTIQVDNVKLGNKNPVLNIQLKARDIFVRDYLVDINFKGTKTIILPQSTPERSLGEFNVPRSNYNFKMPAAVFLYDEVNGLNFRWMRTNDDENLDVKILKVVALNEIETPFVNPTIFLGENKIEFPFNLHTGDFLVYDGNMGRHYDGDWHLKETVGVSGNINLTKGDNRLISSKKQNQAIMWTNITEGEGIRY